MKKKMFNPNNGRFPYADDVIRNIEENNCRFGCIYGANTEDEIYAAGGPGGCCDTLAKVLLEVPMEEIIDEGHKLICTRRIWL